MMNVGYDELQCDLAETYHIYDMHELPLTKVALFSYGLRDNSRIKMKISGVKAPLSDLILAKIFDNTNILIMKDTGAKPSDMPSSLYEVLVEMPKEEVKNNVGFDSIEDFQKAWNNI